MAGPTIYANKVQDGGILDWLVHLFVPPAGHSWDEWIGVWLAAVLTLMLYSFLVRDNRWFRLAEHVFVGTATGYVIARAHADVVVAKCWQPLFNTPPTAQREWGLIIPLVLGVLTFTRLVPSVAWMSRWPLAFGAGVTLGLALITFLQRDCIVQIQSTIEAVRFVDEAWEVRTLPVKTEEDARLLKACADALAAAPAAARPQALEHEAQRLAPLLKEHPGIPLGLVLERVARSGPPPPGGEVRVERFHWRKIVNPIVTFLGVFAGLIYFFFSVEHKGVVGRMARLGIWFLMVSFGAAFGFTIMARLSLLIGRMQFLLGDWLHLKAELSGLPASLF